MKKKCPFRRTPGRNREANSCPTISGIYKKLRKDLNTPGEILESNFLNKGLSGLVENLFSIEAHSLPNLGDEDLMGSKVGPKMSLSGCNGDEVRATAGHTNQGLMETVNRAQWGACRVQQKMIFSLKMMWQTFLT
ncbi:hypothetical protein AAC387_Pa08g1350 [Persea americana]